MQKTKICPKCSGKVIIRIKGHFGINGAGNNIPLNPGSVLVTRYVCAQCGFSEEWIDSEKDILKLQKKYGNK